MGSDDSRTGQPNPGTRVGVDEVFEQMITESPKRVLIYESGDLVPKRLVVW